MSTFNLTADDTVTIFDRTLTDFADGDIATVTFPNDLVNVKSGKNNNTIFALNATGKNANVVLRIMRGSSDDQFLQGKLAAQDKDFASTQLANGEFVKRMGDGQGNARRDVYTLLGGVIVRRVDGKDNQEGDTDQGVATYNMVFANASRSIQ